MGSRITDGAAGLIAIVMLFTVLVMTAGLILFLLILWRVFRKLGSTAEKGEARVRLGAFGAPQSHWWLDTYERTLYKLEDILGRPFTQSPGQLLAGSMIFAALTGAAVAGLVQAAGIPFWPIFITLVLVNGLSAWWLARPAVGWWGGVFEENPNGAPAAGGFRLGIPLDEE